MKRLPRTLSNQEYGKQLIRSSGSVGANYIEANESLGDKDFLMHIKISRKEAKESGYWLKLAAPQGSDVTHQESLIKEATELCKIFGAIYRKKKK